MLPVVWFVPVRAGRRRLLAGLLSCVLLLFAAFISRAWAIDAPLAPLITGFTPGSASPGELVIITGSNLTQVLTIEFNGVSAPVYGGAGDGTSVQTQVPDGAVTGPVTVVTVNGSAVSTQEFEVAALPPPVVTGFTPTSGPVETLVTLTGSGLMNVTNVSFNGVDAQYSTFVGLVAVVPPNATTGPITVRTKQGSFTTAQDFVVTTVLPPTITNFSPTNGYPGLTVTIEGSNLTRIKQVIFANTPSTSFSSMSTTQLWVTVPEGAATGPITVVTEFGSASSSSRFTVNAVPPPVITRLASTSARPGEAVQIVGQHLLQPSVSIRGVAATISASGLEELWFNVPYAASGQVRVTTPGGTALSDQVLTIIGGPPSPRLLGMTPTNGLAGSSVELRGEALGQVLAVAFNGTPAEFEQRDNELVMARIPDLATSGSINVEVADETLTSPEAFHIYNSGDLALFTTASLDTTRIPAPVSFSIAVTNLTQSPIEGLTLTNSIAAGATSADDALTWNAGIPALDPGLPADVSFGEVTSSQGTGVVTNNTVVFNLGVLAPGQSARATVEVRPRSPQALLLLSVATGVGANGAPAYSARLTSVDNGIYLAIAPVGSGQIRITFPLSEPPLVLENASAMGPNTGWLPAAATIVQTNGQNTAVLSIGPEPRFYRLAEKR